jgi:drug/metabolite transporter (DMT)-like permease
VILLPFAWTEKQPQGEWHASAWVALLYLALVCSALCSLMWNRAISSTSSRRLAPTMHIKTPVAILLGVLIANESISFWTIVGTLIISVAIRISARERTLITDNHVV